MAGLQVKSFISKTVCSVYENKVLQLMSAGVRLERFRESTLIMF